MRPCSAPCLVAAVLVLASLTTGACSRTPTEPAPVASTVAKAEAPSRAGDGAATVATAGRCVVPLVPVAPAVPPPAPAAQCPVDPEMGGPKLPTGEVSFPETPGQPKIAVELAMTPRDVERGLMYRRAMTDEQGMLFKLDSRRVQTFWMRNTCIPLDMLFVDDDGTVVGVSESAVPLDESVRSVRCPSTHVLEVNAGWVRKRGVQPGQKMTIPAPAR
jgi:uncharacterized membrane protein (UPF0127 family)